VNVSPRSKIFEKGNFEFGLEFLVWGMSDVVPIEE
jgi:hypothetical protein